MTDSFSKVKFSELEKAILKSLKTDANEQFFQVRNMMIQMADKPAKTVVITSYPACNSVA